VVVAEYGLSDTTLVTAATNTSIWYEQALFFLGGGIFSVFEYAPTMSLYMPHQATLYISLTPPRSRVAQPDAHLPLLHARFSRWLSLPISLLPRTSPDTWQGPTSRTNPSSRPHALCPSSSGQ
jgi:hypothetical protein